MTHPAICIARAAGWGGFWSMFTTIMLAVTADIHESWQSMVFQFCAVFVTVLPSRGDKDSGSNKISVAVPGRRM